MIIKYHISKNTFWMFWWITFLVILGATSAPVDAEPIQQQGDLPSINDVAAYLFLALTGILVYNGKVLVGTIKEVSDDVRSNTERIARIEERCQIRHERE